MINNFNLIRPHLTYNNTGDFYFMQILKRRKENPGMDKDSKVIDNFYIYSIDTFDRLQERIVDLCVHNNARAYLRLNIRNDKKIAFQVLKKVTDLIVSEQYRAINSIYQSTCGEFHSDENKTWVIDIDNTDESYLQQVTDIINRLHKDIIKPGKEYKIKLTLPTKNGFHIITNPFNSSLFEKQVSALEYVPLFAKFLVAGDKNKNPVKWEQLTKISIHRENPLLLFCP